MKLRVNYLNCILRENGKCIPQPTDDKFGFLLVLSNRLGCKMDATQTCTVPAKAIGEETRYGHYHLLAPHRTHLLTQHPTPHLQTHTSLPHCLPSSALDATAAMAPGGSSS
jgi:hypothetical protein